jgi:phytoene dehydrogenase-like protein
VEFHFGTEVTEVVEEDGRVVGVETSDGRRVEADTVVAGAAVPSLYKRQTQPWDRRDEGPRRAPARVVVHLALGGRRPDDAAHRTVVHADDCHAEAAAIFGGDLYGGRPTVTVLRPDDPGLRPDDTHESVTLSAAVPAYDLTNGPASELPRAYEAFADRMVAAAEAAGAALRGRVLWRHVRTPGQAADETGSPGGEVPGPALAGAGGAYLRADNRSALPGLYFVGGWAHPGGGLAHTGMSGAIVADLIAGGPGGSR